MVSEVDVFGFTIKKVTTKSIGYERQTEQKENFACFRMENL